MAKKEIWITKELQNYACKICKRQVQVVLANPCIIETDKTIIHTWDYGHQHKRVFEVIDGEQIPVEDSLDYE